MKKLLVPVIGLIVLLLVIGSMLIYPYNKLVDLDTEVEKSQAKIDTQLQRRLDLIPNLVETVKGYAKHEEKVFKDVSDARAKLAGANTMEEKAEANEQVSSALSRLIAIQENYPELKADTQFTGLRDELAVLKIVSQSLVMTIMMLSQNTTKSLNVSLVVSLLDYLDLKRKSSLKLIVLQKMHQM